MGFQILEHFHDLQICTAVLWSFQRTQRSRNGRIGVRPRRCYHMHGKSRIVSAAVFCMKHQCQIQQPCFQLRIFAVWPHHGQQVFCNGFIRLWFPQYHAAALVEVLRHLVVIHCQRWKTGNQFQTLPHDIWNADVIRFWVGGMQCQHTLFHAVHDVIAWHPHDDAAFKMSWQVLIVCQQFVKGF